MGQGPDLAGPSGSVWVGPPLRIPSRVYGMEGDIAKKVNHCSQEGQLSKWVLPKNLGVGRPSRILLSPGDNWYCFQQSIIVYRKGTALPTVPKPHQHQTQNEIQPGEGEGCQCQCQPLKPPPTQPPTVPNGLFGCTICGWCRAVKTGWWTECTSFLPSPLTIVNTMDDEAFWQEGWSKNS